jgi:hypothetical protein
MAATITSLSYGDLPMNVVSGSDKKMVVIHLVSDAASAGSAVNLATYVPGLTDIAGIMSESDAGVVEGTASTWSTTTLTIGSGYTGVPEITIIGTTSST